MRYTYINSLVRIDAFVIEPVKKIDFFFFSSNTHTETQTSRNIPGCAILARTCCIAVSNVGSPFEIQSQHRSCFTIAQKIE